jgi:signal transduction histidine kinase
MMPEPRLRPGPRAWLRLPRRTARLRFSALYAGLFLFSGAGLLAVTYGLFERATRYQKPRLPTIPKSPAVHHFGQLRLGQSLPGGGPLAGGVPAAFGGQIPQALSKLARVQHQLQRDAHGLYLRVPPLLQGQPGPPWLPVQQQLANDQHLLASDQYQLVKYQHQLARAAHQLAQAVHQVARIAPAQSAQRAADSHELLVDSGIALAIVAVLALLAGWAVAGRMLRPLRDITRTAQRISSTNLHERLALEGPEDELKELGDTLDDLFGRLDASFGAQRHFVANASHELRTPLAAERTMLQFALDDPGTTAATWRSIAEELLASNREQETLIEALLTLASSEGGLDHREPADLAGICGTVLQCPRPEAESLGLRVEADLCPAPLGGDPLLVERLAANLVDTAVRHNVAGGRVQVSTGAKEGRAVLSVSNTGPTVPASEVDRLFQPFQRLGHSRAHNQGGHGLGLSIVRAIADAHGATVDARPGPNGGLRVEVTFPPPNGGTADLREVGVLAGYPG